ncbi:MAG: penicillin acylase family protein [candidate division Zixibacteria bacterium]
MKKFGWIAGVFVVLIISICGGMYIFLKSTLPEYNGSIIIDRIEDKIEIIRDSYGMAHIYAENDNDAAFALGYCTAQDRLFQIEMIRRAVKGRLSELIGPETVDVDRLFRLITSGKSIEERFNLLPVEVKEMMTAYAAGVNQYINNPDANFPIEFSLIGFQPEPWEPADELCVIYYMAWTLNFSFDTELTYEAVRAKIGRELADEIFIDYPKDAPTIIPGQFNLNSANRFLKTVRAARDLTGMPFRGGSNSWVISGEKSKTGMPILANDMHLGFGAPGIWYEAHLNTPNLNVSGVCLPGVPFIIAGANDNVAWGFTNVMADDADYYLEKINPANGNQYEYDGQWMDISGREDTIFVANDTPIVINIRHTRHGVIIDDIIEDTFWKHADTSYSIAMRWTLNDFNDEPTAFYYLNRAANTDEIETAVALYKCPGQNWVYADKDGNIGYWAAVGIPNRDGFDGSRILPGWDSQNEWAGYVETEDQPHINNPENGWIATANNKTIGDDYAHYISQSFAPPDRYIRIQYLLNSKDKLSIDDIKEIHADNYMIAAEKWTPRIISALDSGSLNELESDALNILQDWNYHADKNSSGSSVFHAIMQIIIENIFRERMGDDLYFYYLSHNNFGVHKALHSLLEKDSSEWFDNPGTAIVENRDDVYRKSFSQGVEFLKNNLGDDAEQWQWSRLHSLTFYNSVGRNIPILKNWMYIGPFPVGGSSHTVNPTLYSLVNPWEPLAGASHRHIFDLGNMKNSLRVIPGGISGNFMSPHYDDQVNLWLNVEYRQFQIDWEDITADAAYKLTLIRQSDIDSAIN